MFLNVELGFCSFLGLFWGDFGLFLALFGAILGLFLVVGATYVTDHSFDTVIFIV